MIDPPMDFSSWGEKAHELTARIAEAEARGYRRGVQDAVAAGDASIANQLWPDPDWRFARHAILALLKKEKK